MSCDTPVLILHGGAGRLEEGGFDLVDYRRSLDEIVRAGYDRLRKEGARAAVLHAICLMESDERFNAGRGARLQRDGRARLSASLIDSLSGRFSGVVNVENIEHPILLADLLSGEKHRVLAAEEAIAFARSRGVSYFDPITPVRREEHRRRQASEYGTVGAVALDKTGTICAGTSTGGTGFESPGRVSDSATVAGTYATEHVGISCTGIGEEIVDLAAAARTAARVEEGHEVAAAVGKTIAEGRARENRFGMIALDRYGRAATGETPGVRVTWARCDGEGPVLFPLDR
ncbi:MAG TPA: isoaspartyl peptidase/L-asparaginase [Desulfuromonadales bacterium]|nr:isoaspartyl peptidase/L-asparaginase [Desulfuromonadales bacterium]